MPGSSPSNFDAPQGDALRSAFPQPKRPAAENAAVVNGEGAHDGDDDALPAAGAYTHGLGEEESALLAELETHGWDYDFYTAVRRLENARARWVKALLDEAMSGGKTLTGLPQAVRVGHSQRLADDPVRFCQEPSLAFAPSTIGGLKYRANRKGLSGGARLFVQFIGLLGPNGPMPLHITEYARDRERNAQDPTLARFLDMFNHRVVSLFYRAWAVNQKTVSYERGELDRFAAYVGSLFGVGMPSMLERDRVPDVAKLYSTGHLSAQTRHSGGLRSIIESYFGVETKIVEFVGCWMDLPREFQCRLGESRRTGLLGVNAIVGSRTWEVQQKFRVKLGPMGLREYLRLLPTGDSLGRLVDWVKNYTDEEFRWDVQLVLKKEEVPRTKLGQLGGGGRLGWSTWLTTDTPKNDAEDLVLNPAGW